MNLSLNAYFAKKILFALLIIIFALSSLMILIETIKFLDLIINKGLPFYILFYIIGISLPNILLEILPFAFLGAIMFSWYVMINNQEMIIYQALGMSPLNISKSLLIMSVVLCVLHAYIVMYLAPISYNQYRTIRDKIKDNYSAKLIEPNKFSTIAENTTMYISSLQGNKFENAVIYDKSKHNTEIFLFAKKGYIDFESYENQTAFLLQTVTVQQTDITSGSTSYIKLDKLIFKTKSHKDKTDETIEDKKISTYTLTQLINYPKNNPENLDQIYNVNNEKNYRIFNSLTILEFTIIAIFFLSKGGFNRQGNMKPYIYIILSTAALKSINLLCNLSAINLSIYNGIIILLPVICSYMLYKLYRY